MKHYPSSRRFHVKALLAAVTAMLAACSRHEPEPAEDPAMPRAETTLEGGKLVVVGARPQLAAGIVPQTGGFLEETRWDGELQSLFVKGWVPLDVRADGIRFFLRDPYDRLRLDGVPLVTPQERPDVATAYPDQPAMAHAGFTARLRVTNLPSVENWQNNLELYCLDGAGTCHQLAPVAAPKRRGWSRAADRFEALLTYTRPQLTVPDGTTGSLDVCDPVATDTVHATGWAPFDGRAPSAALIVQLAPRLAPASIVSAGWLPRPDVRAAVDPNNEKLDRSGFDLVLQFNGSLADLQKRGTIRLWCIDGDGHAVEVGLPALR